MFNVVKVEVVGIYGYFNIEFVKIDNGVWNGISELFFFELYSYNFFVDGVLLIDLSN